MRSIKKATVTLLLGIFAFSFLVSSQRIESPESEWSYEGDLSFYSKMSVHSAPEYNIYYRLKDFKTADCFFYLALEWYGETWAGFGFTNVDGTKDLIRIKYNMFSDSDIEKTNSGYYIHEFYIGSDKMIHQDPIGDHEEWVTSADNVYDEGRNLVFARRQCNLLNPDVDYTKITQGTHILRWEMGKTRDTWESPLYSGEMTVSLGYGCSETCTACDPLATSYLSSCDCGSFPTLEFSNDEFIKCQDCEDSIENCEACDYDPITNILTCSQCKESYYLDELTSQCEPCPTLNCKICSSDPDLDFECLTCLDGFGEDPYTGTCVKCPTQCNYCIGTLDSECLCTSNSDSVCTSDDIRFGCKEGYYFSQKVTSNSGQCLPCHESCRRCFNGNSDECTSCWGEGFAIPEGSDRGSCSVEKCHWSCRSCEGPTMWDCSSCDIKEFLDIDGRCKECSSFCVTCHGPDSTDCDSCDDGEYLGEDGRCKKCFPTCRTCSGPGADNCIDCIDEDYIKYQDGRCIIPESCRSPCKTCESGKPQVCTGCISGYYLTEFDNCQKCSNNICPDTPDYRCVKKGCATCEDEEPYDCLTCPDGRFYSVGSCEYCHYSCKTCTGATNTECLSCQNGYTFSGGSCSSTSASSTSTSTSTSTGTSTNTTGTTDTTGTTGTTGTTTSSTDTTTDASS